jgi:hypothetical protein
MVDRLIRRDTDAPPLTAVHVPAAPPTPAAAANGSAPELHETIR